MIKIGIRHNLLYPLLFIFFIFLRRVVKLILERFIDIEGPFIFTMSQFSFEFLIGILVVIFQPRKRNRTSKYYRGIKLIIKKHQIKNRKGILTKILLLFFFAAFFEIYGCYIRRYFFEEFNENISENFHNRFRSLEIIIASILCFLTIGFKIYRHHLISLITIGVCLVLMFFTEFILYNDISIVFKGFLVIFISGICKVFLDLIEKYLFEVNYINLYALMAGENFIDIILSLIFIFLISKLPINEVKYIYENSKMDFALIIFLIIVYGILSALKSIYRRYTIKNYSPMTRCMAESVLDPIFLLYDCFFAKNDYSFKGKVAYFILSIILSVIMVFLGLVFNEFLVIYKWGMEFNTHLEIERRSEESSLMRINDSTTMDIGVDDESTN